MEEIKKKYIVDNENKIIAVQIDFNLFKKIENVLENFGLMKHIQENDPNDIIELDEAREFYKGLNQAN